MLNLEILKKGGVANEIRDFFVVFEKFRFVGQWERKHFLGWPKPGIQFVFLIFLN